MKNKGPHIQHHEEVLFFALHPEQENNHSHALSSLSLYRGGHELSEDDDSHHMLILSSN